MAKAKLTYFDGRGLGELIRMTLTVAGIEYEDVFLKEREEFLQLQKENKIPFGTVPLLEVGKLCIFDTRGILNYAARKGDLFGQSIEEEALVTSYFEASRDCMTKGRFLGFGGFADPKVVLGAWKGALAKFLPLFEKRLASSGNNHLVGSTLTLADLGFFDVCLGALDYFPDILADYPHSKNFTEITKNLEHVSAYMKKRQPPTRIHTPITVKRVLEWDFKVYDPDTGEATDH